MAGHIDARASFGVPRLPPGLIDRPRLTEILDRRAPLTVLSGMGGRGKTALVAHWVNNDSTDERVVWIDLASIWRHDESPWLRILEAFGDAGLVSEMHAARDMIVIAERRDQGPRVLQRAIAAQDAPVLLVLDGLPVDAEPEVYVWATELVGLLRAVPQLRCIAMGRSHEAFGGPGTRAAIETVVIDDAALALTEEEATAIIAHHDRHVDDETATMLARATVGQSASDLRYLLVLTESAEIDLRAIAERDIGSEVTAMVRRDLLGEGVDEKRWTFLGLTAFAPAVTPDLARELSGDAKAEETLNELARAGLGQWTTLPHAGRAFRASELLRSVASADLIRNHPRAARRARSITAAWLLEVAKDPLGAMREAIDADDLALVERTLIHVYPLSADGPVPAEWLERVPAHRVHQHPLLALVRALQLNASSASQARAAEYFLSASVMGRLKSSRTPSDEQAIRLGLESLTWRMLGREQLMVDRARRCLEVIESGPDDGSGASNGTGQRMTIMMVRAMYQAALGLMSADMVEEAKDAFHRLESAAIRAKAYQYVNVAVAGMALVQVLDGEVKAAEKYLARIDPDAWPDTWRDGYMEAPHLIARGWVHLHSGEPALALACIEALDDHVDSIEFWGFMLEVRALALAWLGRIHEAEFAVQTVRADREGKTTLPFTRARMDSLSHLLGLVVGAVRETPRTRANEKPNPVRYATAALTTVATGDHERATAWCLKAHAHAQTPQHHAMANIAGVAVGHATGERDLVARSAARLSLLVHDHGVRLPVALLTEDERAAALATLPSTSPENVPLHRESLEHAFNMVMALGEVSRSATVSVPELTASERELLVMLASSQSRAEIAEDRFVSINTIKTQLRNLYAKLGTASRDEAVARAVAWGLLTRPDAPDRD